ncbi:MAG: hypothetical protein JWN70_6015 [Planctomycetaceae bacterium]|nr:hypothetical protein [Planctomycetaceae bacterium]
MEDPEDSSAQAATGNVAVPDWMLKRRARQAQAGARNAATGHATADPALTTDSLALEAVASESEVDTVKDLAPPGKEPPAWFRPPAARPTQPPAVAIHAVAAAEFATPSQAESVSETEPEIDPDEEIIDLGDHRDVRHVSDEEVVDVGVALPPVEAETPVPLEWHAELRERWLGKAALRSYGISVCMHLMAGLMLSLVVFHEEVVNLGLNTLMAVQGEDAALESLDDTTVFQVDASGGQTSDNLNTMLAASAVSNALGPSSLRIPDDIGGLSKGEGDGKGDEIGVGLNVGGYKMPEGGKAVNKGSFTAWTVPEDPKPGEDYKIVIQVKYKKRNLKIPKGDITGSVIGTDKFRLMISPSTSEVIAEANQVVIYVPGAAARVRDTIRVYSATLKENQRLEIVF